MSTLERHTGEFSDEAEQSSPIDFDQPYGEDKRKKIVHNVAVLRDHIHNLTDEEKRDRLMTCAYWLDDVMQEYPSNEPFYIGGREFIFTDFGDCEGPRTLNYVIPKNNVVQTEEANRVKLFAYTEQSFTFTSSNDPNAPPNYWLALHFALRDEFLHAA